MCVCVCVFVCVCVYMDRNVDINKNQYIDINVHMNLYIVIDFNTNVHSSTLQRCISAMGWLRLVESIKLWSLLQNIISLYFIGLFCIRDV